MSNSTKFLSYGLPIATVKGIIQTNLQGSYSLGDDVDGVWVTPPPSTSIISTIQGLIQSQAFNVSFSARLGETDVGKLTSMTPAQLTSWVNTNVADLPSARSALLRLALIVRLIALYLCATE